MGNETLKSQYFEEIIQLFSFSYLIFMISLCYIYMWSMYTQYKNAHDKWYDINREYDLSPRKEISYKYKTPRDHREEKSKIN